MFLLLGGYLQYFGNIYVGCFCGLLLLIFQVRGSVLLVPSFVPSGDTGIMFWDWMLSSAFKQRVDYLVSLLPSGAASYYSVYVLVNGCQFLV